MDEPLTPQHVPGHRTGDDPNDVARARSFGSVADAYDRGRPSYPRDAVDWLVNRPESRVLELGAGTGKLTELLVEAGHHVVATDPSVDMLDRLARRAPDAAPVVASAEAVPLASRSVDAVACAQAFHWFDTDLAFPEIVRVLRPGGVLALVWNDRDERIPWVKKLGRLIGEAPGGASFTDVVRVIDDSGLFEQVQTARFRIWQPMTQQSLRDLVASRSNIAVMAPPERERILGQVDDLYADYGRGPDGMLLPYVTYAFRTVALPWAAQEESVAGGQPSDLDTDSLLIDFR